MRKIAYLCILVFLCSNMIAQIDPYDRNWDTLFIDNFSGIRTWSNLWEDNNSSVPNYNPIWICFVDNLWDDGVTHYNSTHNKFEGLHAYQKENAVFGTDQTMKLKCEFKSAVPTSCVDHPSTGSQYTHAPWTKYCHFCNSVHIHPNIHFFSGTIETIDTVGFGYYEIECKIPVHDGECSAFWFWSNLGGTYNEIDVFEHSTKLSENNLERGVLGGIWYNPLSTNYDDPSIGNVAIRYTRHLHTFPDTTTVEEYHTYGCLWMPDRVAWFVDGEMVHEHADQGQIPQNVMWLKITHYVEEKIKDTTGYISWTGNDEMTINYIKALRLKTNCNADVSIRNINDFNNFIYSVKHSITMGGQNITLSIPNNEKFTMRAVESITIDGPFELPHGAEMTLLVQDCPQCTKEGIVLPQHNCGTKENE